MDKTLTLDNRIARSDIWFYPGEELGPDEMRVTLMGTGWGNIIRPNQKGASIYIELGNHDAFVFDTGPGCCVNYNVMQVPFSRMDKVFLTHLHTDHCSDLDWIYTFGPSVDRFTPFHVFGPHNFANHPSSGGVAIPDMIEFVRGLKQSTHWHTVSFEATLNVGSAYDIVVHPLNYRAVPPVAPNDAARGQHAFAASQPLPDHVTVAPMEEAGIAYRDPARDVTISHWPALHIIDGAISYCLEWNGYKVVWSGDTRPNHYMVTFAKDADLLIHETAPSVARFVQAQHDSPEIAERIIQASHTPARALGKILSVTNPTVAVTCHSPIDPEEWDSYCREVRSWWMNPESTYQIGEDLMVFTLSRPGAEGSARAGRRNSVSIRKGGIHERPWGVRVARNSADGPSLPVADYRTEVFDRALADREWQAPNVEGLERRLEAARKAAQGGTPPGDGSTPPASGRRTTPDPGNSGGR